MAEEYRRLHEQIADMDLQAMSKCELLQELSGVECSTTPRLGCTEDVTPCRECREHQQAALIGRIVGEYLVNPVGTPRWDRQLQDWTCPKCGRRMDVTWRFCPDCGMKVVMP